MSVSVMVTDRVAGRYNRLMDTATLYHKCERCGRARLLLIRVAWDERLCATCWGGLSARERWPTRTFADEQREAEALTAPPGWPILEAE